MSVCKARSTWPGRVMLYHEGFLCCYHLWGTEGIVWLHTDWEGAGPQQSSLLETSLVLTNFRIRQALRGLGRGWWVLASHLSQYHPTCHVLFRKQSWWLPQPGSGKLFHEHLTLIGKKIDRPQSLCCRFHKKSGEEIQKSLGLAPGGRVWNLGSWSYPPPVLPCHVLS